MDKDATKRIGMDRGAFLRRTAAGILVAVGGAALFDERAQAAYVEQLMRTPPLTEGPFYPDRLPLDQDNDLIVIGKSTSPALGQIAHLRGRVLTTSGEPVRGATVEIWQCDANQVYLNSRDSVPKRAQQDRNFQGFGKFETSSKGEYYFRTIKPVPYPGRPAGHIHVKVKKGGRELLTTQILVRGAAGNSTDNVYAGVRDSVDRELILADFTRIKESKIGELSAHFDIVLGRTPDEASLKAGRVHRV